MGKIYWLASYPKSGNTWLRILLSNYQSKSDQPVNINQLNLSGEGFARKYFDEVTGIDSADLTRNQIEYYRPRFYEKMAVETSETLFVKLHDAFNYNAENEPIFPNKASAGAIYIIRNPLDVAVSFAHHQNEPVDRIIGYMKKSEFTLAKYHERQLPQLVKSWSENVYSWVENAEIAVHTVRYEDLLAQPIKVFTGIINFAKLPFSDIQIKKAVEFSSFKRLQLQENEHGFGEKQPTAKSFFRKGTANSWRETLTEEQVRQIISDHREIMLRFGYINGRNEII